MTELEGGRMEINNSNPFHPQKGHLGLYENFEWGVRDQLVLIFLFLSRKRVVFRDVIKYMSITRN